jgi:predicted ATP-dependent endonuclease of OLD family
VAAVDILSLVYARKSRVVMIDEIENGIHYSVLRGLWWHIKRAARATGTQIIATTHSRECIAAAQDAFVQDGQQMLSLIRLWRRSADSDVSATSYGFAELENALDLSLDIR